MRETAPIAQGRFGELSAADAHTLRVFSTQSGQSLLEVYDLHDPDAPVRLSRCTVSDVGFIGAFTFSPRHAFARAGAINDVNSVTSIELRPDGACQVRMHSGRWRSMHPLARC